MTATKAGEDPPALSRSEMTPVEESVTKTPIVSLGPRALLQPVFVWLVMKAMGRNAKSWICAADSMEVVHRSLLVPKCLLESGPAAVERATRVMEWSV